MRRHHYQSEIARLLLIGGFGALAFASCSQTAAPEPPSPVKSTSTEDSGTSDSSDSGDSALGSSKSRDSSSSSDSKDSSSSDLAFDFGGAAIGDDDDKEAVKKCHEEGHVYDRFADDGGKCSTLPLAQLDCTKSGIKAVLSDSQKSSFAEKLSGSFDGWEIDQCGDCPDDSDNDLCQSTSGSKQTGTKVYFVMEDADQIKGKALVLPVRPDGSQGSSGSGSGSGSSSGSGSGSGSGLGSGTGSSGGAEDDPFALTH